VRLLRFWRAFAEDNATGKRTLLLVLLTLSVYTYMLLYSIPAVMAYANDMKLLDMMPTGYSTEYVRSLLGELGEEGRSAYLWRQIPVDMIYPPLFALSFSFLLSYVLHKGYNSNHRIHWLCITPLAAGLFDYLENGGIVFLLLSYPDLPSWSVTLTSIFSVAKASFTTVTGVSIIVVSIVVGLKLLLSPVRNGTTG
jgi:hypothetical protein